MAAAATRRTGSEPAAVTGPGTPVWPNPQRRPGGVRNADLLGSRRARRRAGWPRTPAGRSPVTCASRSRAARRAVSAQGQFVAPVHAVYRTDRRPAPIPRLVHLCPRLLAESWPGGRRAPGTGQAASGPGSQVAGAAASAASWRTQRIRSAAAWGWSPNSWAIRLTQPRVPNRRTARLIAAATLSAAGAADRCSAEANSASHHASSTFNQVLAVLLAVDVLAGEGTGSPGAGASRRAKRTGNPPAVRACVWMDVLDEVVMVSLLTRRLSCCCG